MRAYCPQVSRQGIHGAHDLRLGAAHVGEDGAGFAHPSQLLELRDDRAHWRA
jgi:hypothetical protein